MIQEKNLSKYSKWKGRKQVKESRIKFIFSKSRIKQIKNEDEKKRESSNNNSES